MENVWSDGISGERKDLAPIMEEEDKGQAKGKAFSLFFFLFFSFLPFLAQRNFSIQN